MASLLNYLAEGSRIFLYSYKNRLSPKKYSGSAEEICRQLVKDCWNGRYFQTSLQNFPQFWARDFGWCTQSLLTLGYRKEVYHTLRYALNRFKTAGKMTTTISTRGTPFDVFVPAVDSLPWLVHSIKVSKFPYHSLKDFLNRHILRFYEAYIDEQTGLVKQSLHVSSMKDYAIRQSSCYDNCMVGLLAQDLQKLKLFNPLKKYDYPALLKRHFWSGTFFYDDVQQKPYVAGDANVFPFLFSLCRDEEMLKSAMHHLQQAGLDQPLPLKYTASREGVLFSWQELFMRNYESNAVWTHMGPFFIKLVAQVDKEKASAYKQKYREIIEHYGGFPEVLSSHGKLFTSPFYRSDTTMLWACNYLTL